MTREEGGQVIDEVAYDVHEAMKCEEHEWPRERVNADGPKKGGGLMMSLVSNTYISPWLNLFTMTDPKVDGTILPWTIIAPWASLILLLKEGYSISNFVSHWSICISITNWFCLLRVHAENQVQGLKAQVWHRVVLKGRTTTYLLLLRRNIAR